MKSKFFFQRGVCPLLLSIAVFTLVACGDGGVDSSISADVSPGSNAELKENFDQASKEVVSESLDEMPLEIKAAISAYEEFLNGSTSALDSKHAISEGDVTIQDLAESTTRYAFFDMNGDGVPELHLKSGMAGYTIFTYRDEKVALWHNGPDYELPLNNGAILYERVGAAPTHTNYYYLLLDFEGNEASKVYFSKYHSINETDSTESADYDVFMLDEKEVSKEEWDLETKMYFMHLSDQITWEAL